jgi:hypothetical protein
MPATERPAAQPQRVSTYEPPGNSPRQPPATRRELGPLDLPPAAAREPSSPHPKNPAPSVLAKPLRVGTPALRHVHQIAARQVAPAASGIDIAAFQSARRLAQSKTLRVRRPAGISARFWTAAALCRFCPLPSRNPCSSVVGNSNAHCPNRPSDCGATRCLPKQ